MPGLSEQAIACPCCGETVTVIIDDSVPQQCYVEDCPVCCRPMVLDIVVGPDGDVAVAARSENG
jgi:Cysteine-rich CPXCG